MSHRIAVLEKESCHSNKCQLECIRFCPVNKTGGDCIVLGQDAKAIISEELCTGCGICVKKCPFEAITIVNLAEEIGREKVHQYGVNDFRLYRLPTPRYGYVVGLVGKNGTGKTTAINVLAGLVKPNFGLLEREQSWEEIIDCFRGTELINHFERIASGKLRVSIKPQAIYEVQNRWKGDGSSLLKAFDETGNSRSIAEELSLIGSLQKPVKEISGGELQRLAVAAAASKDADIYFFDEPSSYNDVYQRLAVAKVIIELASRGKAVVLVEHDLTLLDYLSDYVHLLYGEGGAYGIVSSVLSTRTGINILLEGYMPTENVRFRDSKVIFPTYSPISETVQEEPLIVYGSLAKSYPGFTLTVEGGKVRRGEIVGVLGANALGKTTFLKMVAGDLQPDEGGVELKSKVSYKPQYIDGSYDGEVQEYLKGVGEMALDSGLIQSQIIQPLSINKLYERKVKDLSGGELQRVAIASCLLKDVEIYALDEPSAFIDVEERFHLAKAIQRFVKSSGKSAIVVEHDIHLLDIVADSVIIFSGVPSEEGRATPPMAKGEGMNLFLKSLGITYRRDPQSGRPRVNKLRSKLDREQKEEGRYYYMDRIPVPVAEA